MGNEAALRRAVFFDRDGTLNVDTGYLYRQEDFRWIPGAVDAIRHCNRLGCLVIVVTNQSGVARGYFKEEDVHSLHRWMNEELEKQGAHIDAFYYCPHHPKGTVAEYAKECACRKPAPGLVDMACRDYSIDRKRSLMIGDKDRDVECAHRAGVRGILYPGGSLLDALQPYL